MNKEVWSFPRFLVGLFLLMIVIATVRGLTDDNWWIVFPVVLVAVLAIRSIVFSDQLTAKKEEVSKESSEHKILLQRAIKQTKDRDYEALSVTYDQIADNLEAEGKNADKYRKDSLKYKKLSENAQ